MDSRPAPVRVALVNDYEVVVRGLHTLLGGDPRVRVTQLASVVDPTREADVALFDTFATSGASSAQVRRLVAGTRARRVVIFSWDVSDEQIRCAFEAGADGYLSKSLSREALVEALLRVHRGERVVERGLTAASATSVESPQQAWPGRPEGLTQREAEVVSLVTQGLTNEEITRRLFISANSLKTHIRHAYRKMGATRRSEAILWGIAHGMNPAAAVHEAPSRTPAAPSARPAG